MNSCHHERREIAFYKDSSISRDPEILTEQRLRGGSAKTDNCSRFYQLDLSVQPWPARIGLLRIRLLVYASFAARFPFEVFHNVRHISLTALDAGLLERGIENPPGGANKRA